MTNFAGLDGLTAALETAWADALPAFGSSAVDQTVQGDIEAMNDAGLVRVVGALADARRRLDALLARAAAEVDRRSGPEFGVEGLAKQHGFHNAGRLVASATGGSAAEAARLSAVGRAVRSRASLVGERMPPRHPYLATALDDGTISLDAAAAIVGMFARVAPRAEPSQADAYEHELVRFAAGQSFSLVTRALKLAEARLDEDGVEPRDDERFEGRSVTITEETSGMVRITARLDPVTAAPVKAAIDALVSDALRRRADAADTSTSLRASRSSAGAGSEEPTIIEDRRSLAQMQADALAELASHALGCEDSTPALARTTVVVRMSLDALLTAVGVAEVDGLDQPVSAASVRRLAVDAEFVPAVLGGASVPLDFGRGSRLFSRAQRLALGERDGGCASCGRNATWAQAHHIEWWTRDAGPTDLDNGVMLCSFCHHQVHREGWAIRVRDGEVWFTPPPHVDPDQKPRLGGRARFELRDPVAA